MTIEEYYRKIKNKELIRLKHKNTSYGATALCVELDKDSYEPVRYVRVEIAENEVMDKGEDATAWEFTSYTLEDALDEYNKQY